MANRQADTPRTPLRDAASARTAAAKDGAFSRQVNTAAVVRADNEMLITSGRRRRRRCRRLTRFCCRRRLRCQVFQRCSLHRTMPRRSDHRCSRAVGLMTSPMAPPMTQRLMTAGSGPMTAKTSPPGAAAAMAAAAAARMAAPPRPAAADFSRVDHDRPKKSRFVRIAALEAGLSSR